MMSFGRSKYSLGGALPFYLFHVIPVLIRLSLKIMARGGVNIQPDSNRSKNSPKGCGGDLVSPPEPPADTRGWTSNWSFPYNLDFSLRF